MTEHELANKWIQELQADGFTPDEMLKVFQVAREKYNERKKIKSHRKDK